MIVKNEEAHLEECLESLTVIRKALSAELIIVDTGSTDRTLEIARSYTDQVYCHAWNDDFGAMRNLSISYAKGDWILVLDGDEVIAEENDLIDFFKSHRCRSYNSATVKICNYKNKQRELSNNGTLLRLFKRKGFKYIGAVHEQPQFQEPIYHLDISICHYGYQIDDSQLMAYKFNRNVPILLKELEKDPKNPYLYFQLSQSYGMHNDFVKGLAYIQEAYQVCVENRIDLKKRMYVYVQLLNMLDRNQDFQGLITYAEEAIALQPGYVDLYFFYGGALASLNQINEAITAYERYIYIAENYHAFVGYNDISVPNLTIGNLEKVKGRLCTLYYNQGEYQQVIRWSAAICDEKVEAQIMSAVIEAYFKLDQQELLIDYYRKRVASTDIMRESYFNGLEIYGLKMDLKRRGVLWEAFIEESGPYGLLNRIRLDRLDKPALLKAVQSLNFNELPSYYGEILYYCLQKKIDICLFLAQCDRDKLREIMQHIFNAYQGEKNRLFEGLLNYVQNFMPRGELNQGIVLRCFLLSHEDISDEIYLGIFQGYIQSGIIDLKKTYLPQLLEELDQNLFLRTREDRFFLHMLHFMKNQESNPKMATEALREVVRAFPEFKRGLNLFTQEFQKRLGINSDLQEAVNTLRIHLNQLVADGHLEEAKGILAEYQKLQHEESVVFALKSMIEIIENRWETGEETILQGLIRYPNSVDLLCNGAYLYQRKGNLDKALDYYRWALEWIQEPGEREIILEQILLLEETREATPAAVDSEQLVHCIQELIVSQDYDKALVLIEAHGKDSLDKIQTLLLKSMIHMALGEYGVAEGLLKEGFGLDPLNIDLMVNMGYLYQQLGENAVALEFYHLAINTSKDENQKQILREAVAGMAERVTVPGPDGYPKTSIVIQTNNDLACTQNCIESIHRYTQEGTYEILVVDNASTDGSVAWLQDQRDIKLVLNPQRNGLAQGYNQGINLAESGNDVLFLSHHAVVTPSWLVNLKIALYSAQHIGAVGSAINFDALRPESNAAHIQAFLDFAEVNNSSKTSSWQESVYLMGGCMLVKRAAINQLGLFDERFTFNNFIEKDYALGLRAQEYHTLLCNNSLIYSQREGYSFKKASPASIEELEKNKTIFKEKWGVDPEELDTLARNQI